MLLKIASRKSDLARLQAVTVAKKIKEIYPDIQIVHEFSASMGDKNLDVPLWTMGSKGVFTQDFHDRLVTGEVDMVVHSWKDLPIEERIGTYIAGTLKREDLRDVLLVNRSQWNRVYEEKKISVLTSSPRRAYNLEPHLTQLLPGDIETLEFRDVRGNIPTRIDKLLAKEGDALIMAKAALDRMLGTDLEDFQQVKMELREKLDQCKFMVLPLSINPAAAAQGALAIEIACDRPEIAKVVEKIHCEETFEQAKWERETLAGYGGGCHQKIGVSKIGRSYGEVEFLKGLTDKGEVLDRVEICNPSEEKNEPVSKEKIWCQTMDNEHRWFDRIPVKEKLSKQPNALWVSRSNAWPDQFDVNGSRWVWTSGLTTWKNLAQKGVWVHGCADSLGEIECAGMDELAGEKIGWTKLSHGQGKEIEGVKFLSTYELRPSDNYPDLQGKTYFFWRSGSSFLRALSLFPEVSQGNHACGPGHTFMTIKENLPEGASVRVCLNESLWLKSLGH